MYSDLLENYGPDNWMVIGVKCSFRAKFFIKKDTKKEIMSIVENGIVHDSDKKSTQAIIDNIYDIISYKKLVVSIDRELSDRYILVSIR